MQGLADAGQQQLDLYQGELSKAREALQQGLQAALGQSLAESEYQNNLTQHEKVSNHYSWDRAGAFHLEMRCNLCWWDFFQLKFSRTHFNQQLLIVIYISVFRVYIDQWDWHFWHTAAYISWPQASCSELIVTWEVHEANPFPSRRAIVIILWSTTE